MPPRKCPGALDALLKKPIIPCGAVVGVIAGEGCTTAFDGMKPGRARII
jgi:hypothetical protein